jgi:hypothetical protein
MFTAARSMRRSLAFAIAVSSLGIASAKPPQLVTKSADGSTANGGSSAPTLSSSGRHVVFDSTAANLSALDMSAANTVFVRDMKTGKLKVASLKDDESPISAPCYQAGITSNGRRVAFMAGESGIDPSVFTNSVQVYLRDLKLGKSTIASLDYEDNPVSGDVTRAALSASGRYIAFVTTAPFVVDGVANGKAQVYLRDRVAGTIELVSGGLSGFVANDDCDGPRISKDGRYVFFISLASNLVASDSNANWDIFVRDRQAGTTTRVSVGVNGQLSQPTLDYAISASGERVVFVNSASVLGGNSTPNGGYAIDWKVGFVQSIADVPQLASLSGITNGISLSGNGKRVVVSSYADPGMDLNGSLSDIFVCDIEKRTVTRDIDGEGADDDSIFCAISQNGEYVTYASDADDLLDVPATIKSQVFRQKL